MVVRVRNPRGQSGFTNPYRISRILGTTHWWFWFGVAQAYQSLPTRTRIPLGAFGRVGPPFTNRYHSPDLGAHLPRDAFTNSYHRGLGQGIDVSVAGIVHQVAGWGTVFGVHNVAQRGEPYGTLDVGQHGGGSVSRRKIFFESGRSLIKHTLWW